MLFYKFDGAGNDFVIVDNREGRLSLTQEQISRICHRRFGIGADGLITLNRAPQGFDFEMCYYNSDGRLGSMCGNGGRCIAAFAHILGLGDVLNFIGFDGPHSAEILQWDPELGKGIVKLAMKDIDARQISSCLDGSFLDTGSPHYVQSVDDLDHFDVVGVGRRIRHMSNLFPDGTNVDFIQHLPDGRLAVRTYERGVEDETWACGTGVTAAAIVSGCHNLVAPGGQFRVDFQNDGTLYRHVYLTGPVSLNFTGHLPQNLITLNS